MGKELIFDMYKFFPNFFLIHVYIKIMENITFTLSEMQRTLVSINAYLAAFAEEVENKKKKVDKKKKETREKKRNILYTKKTNAKNAVILPATIVDANKCN